VNVHRCTMSKQVIRHCAIQPRPRLQRFDDVVNDLRLEQRLVTLDAVAYTRPLFGST
jgi:hypothetical protein